MAKIKSVKDVRNHVVQAALLLASEKPWRDVSLKEIASAAGCSLSALREVFDDKGDILAAYTRQIDMRVMESSGPFEDSDPVKDRLFDILMERFEALNENRVGLLSILSGMRQDPVQAMVCFPGLVKSMVWMMEAAGLETAGYRGAVKAAGLAGVYVRCLKVWCEDESPDLSKTMSALDQTLGRAERFASTFGL